MTGRRAPRLPLPARAFIPGRGLPHPREDAARPAPEGPDEAFAYGLDLWDAGFFWEAHEAWEDAWRAAVDEEGRASEAASLLQAIIKLAAARVKVAQGQPAGVRSHAEGALERLAPLARPPARYPVDLDAARAVARALLEGREPPPLRAAKVPQFDRSRSGSQ